MIRLLRSCCRRTERITIAALLVACALAIPAAAQSAGCNRARAIVEEVAVMIEAPNADHKAILQKLRTAHQLCPTLGDAWKYAYCSASILGDQQSARVYKERAIFNGVSQVECQTAAGNTGQLAPLPTYVRQKYALVVGIGRFKDASIPKLQYAAKDAKDVAALLADPQHGNFDPANITLLTDEQATRAAILNAMQQIFLQAREEDLVVTYVSSHGSPAEQERGLGGIGYIVTYDANVKNLWVDGLEYKDFAKKTMMIKARRKVTFLDTCFSGEASKRGEKALAIEGLGVDEGTAKMFLSGEGTFVITSSSANERSWESERIQNSYFTFYLLDALKRSKEPPTIREVFQYLSERVPTVVAREKQAPQHPQMQPADGPGDLRIGVVPRDSSNH
jgi:hypothetical protein